MHSMGWSSSLGGPCAAAWVRGTGRVAGWRPRMRSCPKPPERARPAAVRLSIAAAHGRCSRRSSSRGGGLGPARSLSAGAASITSTVYFDACDGGSEHAGSPGAGGADLTATAYFDTFHEEPPAESPASLGAAVTCERASPNGRRAARQPGPARRLSRAAEPPGGVRQAGRARAPKRPAPCLVVRSYRMTRVCACMLR